MSGGSIAWSGQAAGGRVDVAAGQTGTPFHLFSDAGKSMKETMAMDALKNMELNSTARLFMSPVNLDAVQDGIRYVAFVQSQGKHTIGRQSDMEVIAVMRSMYLQHGRNTTRPNGSADLEEVRRLNGIVIEYCVARVLSEIEIYIRYKSDIARAPVLMDRGEFSSSKGSRSLSSVGF